MENNVEFVNGMIFKLPREGAPDFVKGSISVKRAELIEFLNSKSDEWINIDLKVGKSGKAFAAVNNWKPEGQTQGFSTPSVSNNTSNDLPF
ncbi:MAG: hypothetical protein GOVbin4342_14 [Prokaryotic dsDNA virus sp.]|nr:MAG: hypothetical protein GOVbin4342_14 [Prokaryotic dsDNA virus sp.]|tara:strand:- start:943 stop:1215 length:273 start_codon:yes stop_codon:yes gene_type:complete